MGGEEQPSQRGSLRKGSPLRRGLRSRRKLVWLEPSACARATARACRSHGQVKVMGIWGQRPNLGRNRSLQNSKHAESLPCHSLDISSVTFTTLTPLHHLLLPLSPAPTLPGCHTLVSSHLRVPHPGMPLPSPPITLSQALAPLMPPLVAGQLQ